MFSFQRNLTTGTLPLERPRKAVSESSPMRFNASRAPHRDGVGRRRPFSRTLRPARPSVAVGVEAEFNNRHLAARGIVRFSGARAAAASRRFQAAAAASPSDPLDKKILSCSVLFIYNKFGSVARRTSRPVAPVERDCERESSPLSHTTMAKKKIAKKKVKKAAKKRR